MKIPDEYLKLHRRCYGTFDKASVAECSCFNCKRVFSGAEIKDPEITCSENSNNYKYNLEYSVIS